MGKGDKKSKKGKIIRGTYGVSRPRKRKNDSLSKAEPVEKKETESKRKSDKAKK